MKLISVAVFGLSLGILAAGAAVAFITFDKSPVHASHSSTSSIQAVSATLDLSGDLPLNRE
ncbi:hypothetical protein KAI87_02510 [Myxococcota bacterium]|nr:hypothetical protein [Myxococcota bacterium]